jgi:hypothetical protein
MRLREHPAGTFVVTLRNGNSETDRLTGAPRPAIAANDSAG